MIAYLSGKISKLLIHHSTSDNTSASILEYGIETLLYSILSTFGLIIIGFIFNSVIESITIITLFYVNQTIGGGYHASTHTRCFLTMSGSLSILLLLIRIDIPALLIYLSGIISGLYLLINPVILHRNKSYLSAKHKKFSSISRAVIVTELIVAIVLYACQALPASYVYAIVLSAISRLIAKHLQNEANMQDYTK